jgi:hypothetical protein
MGRKLRTVRVGIVGVLATVGLVSAATPAQGAFHLMKIREVNVSTTNSSSEFVELQMYAAGQNFVQGHSVHFYSPAGTNSPTATFDINVPNGENQSTILIATSDAESEFGVEADKEVVLGPNDLNPVGGAVCFENIDCVSWGSFSGEPMSPTGTPAPAFSAGSSLERSIAPSCPTLLEAGDDTNNSATDFGLAAPSPRNNAAPPTETACGPGTGAVGPDTKLDKKPKDRTRKKRVTYEFSSTDPAATFECKLDDRPRESCTSPETYRVKKGKHEFEVRAVDAAGNVDQTPAEDSFKVKKKKKKKKK